MRYGMHELRHDLLPAHPLENTLKNVRFVINAVSERAVEQDAGTEQECNEPQHLRPARPDAPAHGQGHHEQGKVGY
jgi:hypothetical protein